MTSKVNAAARDQVAAVAASRFYAKGYQTHFSLNEDEHKLFEKLVGGPVFRSGSKQSSHPILAELLHKANRSFDHIREAGCIEIGPDPRLDQPSHQSLWVFANEDGRDQARHIQHATAIGKRAEKTANQIAFVKAVNGSESNVCMRGIQNCDHKNTTGLAVHSLYDIPPYELCMFFKRSGMRVLYAVMHLPHELAAPNLPAATYYKVSIGQYTTMSVHGEGRADTSYGYHHKTKLLRHWLTCPAIDAECGGERVQLLIEQVRWEGIQCYMTITRVTEPAVIPKHICPFSGHYYYIPNFRYILTHGKRDHSQDIVVESWIVDRVLIWAAASTPETFNLTTFMNYLRATTTTVNLGQVLHLSTWRTDGATFSAAATNLYLTAKSLRLVQVKHDVELTAAIKDDASFAMAQEKRWAPSRGWSRLKRAVKRKWARTGYHAPDWEILPEKLDKMGLLHLYRPMPVQPSGHVWRTLAAPNGALVPIPLSSDDATPPNLSDAFDAYVTSLIAADHPAAADAYKILAPLSAVETRIRVMTGVPGSGKSRWVRQTFPNAVISTPTQELAKDYEGLDVHTQHRVFAHVGEVVVVDEAFQQPLGYFAALAACGAKDIIAVGDPNQIPYIDFEKNGDAHWSFAEHYQKYPLVEELQITHRCPQDVTYLLRQMGITIATTSKVRHSIFMHEGRPREGHVITFTQKDKARFPSANTVHEVQGKTYPTVQLYLSHDAKPLLQNSRSHKVVALSRHTQELHVYYEGCQPAIYNIAPVANAVFDALDITVLPYQATSEPVEIPIQLNEQPLITPSAEPIGVDPILSKVTASDEFSGRVAVMRVQMPDEQMKLREITVDFRPIPMYHMLGADYAHHTMVNDKVTTLATLISRYAKFTHVAAPADQATTAKLMFARWKDAYITQITPPKELDIMPLMVDMLTRMGQRGTLERVDLLDIMDNRITVVEFFLKQQAKVKTSTDFNPPGHLRGKAGQGISAWSKTMNTVLGTAVRAVQRGVAQSLRPEVLLAYSMNELAMSDVLQGDYSQLITLEGDISEFDCNQGPITVAFEALVWEAMGIDARLIKLYTLLRTTWKLTARDVGVLYGHHKQHSGQPATLFGNSLITMGIMALCFDNLKNCTTAFKGDDSIILGPAQFNPVNNEINDQHIRLPVKLIEGVAPQFINHFVTSHGLVPDVVRMAAKVKSKFIRPTAVNPGKFPNTVIVSSTISGNVHAVVHGNGPLNAKRLSESVVAFHDRWYVQESPEEISPFLYACARKRRHTDTLHIEYNPALSRAQWKHLMTVLNSWFAKIWLHKGAFPVADKVKQYQQSVVDRLRPLRSADLMQVAIAAASNYYHLPTGEVEYCLNFLNTFATMKKPHRWYAPYVIMPRVVEQTIDDLYFLPEVIRRRAITAHDPRTRSCRSALKIDELLDFFPGVTRVVDISCAPGGWVRRLTELDIGCRAYHYVGPGALPLYRDIDSTPYVDLDSAPLDFSGAELILSDAAPDMNGDDREKQALALLKQIRKVIVANPLPYVVKINCTNHRTVQELVESFPRKRGLVRSRASTPLSNELYLIGTDGPDCDLDWLELADAANDKLDLPTIEQDFVPLALGDITAANAGNYLLQHNLEWYFFKFDDGPIAYAEVHGQRFQVLGGPDTPVTVINHAVTVRNVQNRQLLQDATHAHATLRDRAPQRTRPWKRQAPSPPEQQSTRSIDEGSNVRADRRQTDQGGDHDNPGPRPDVACQHQLHAGSPALQRLPRQPHHPEHHPAAEPDNREGANLRLDHQRPPSEDPNYRRGRDEPVSSRQRGEVLLRLPDEGSSERSSSSEEHVLHRPGGCQLRRHPVRAPSTASGSSRRRRRRLGHHPPGDPHHLLRAWHSDSGENCGPHSSGPIRHQHLDRRAGRNQSDTDLARPAAGQNPLRPAEGRHDVRVPPNGRIDAAASRDVLLYTIPQRRHHQNPGPPQRDHPDRSSSSDEVGHQDEGLGAGNRGRVGQSREGDGPSADHSGIATGCRVPVPERAPTYRRLGCQVPGAASCASRGTPSFRSRSTLRRQPIPDPCLFGSSSSQASLPGAAHPISADHRRASQVSVTDTDYSSISSRGSSQSDSDMSRGSLWEGFGATTSQDPRRLPNPSGDLRQGRDLPQQEPSADGRVHIDVGGHHGRSEVCSRPDTFCGNTRFRNDWLHPGTNNIVHAVARDGKAHAGFAASLHPEHMRQFNAVPFEQRHLGTAIHTHHLGQNVYHLVTKTTTTRPPADLNAFTTALNFLPPGDYHAPLLCTGLDRQPPRDVLLALFARPYLNFHIYVPDRGLLAECLDTVISVANGDEYHAARALRIDLLQERSSNPVCAPTPGRKSRVVVPKRSEEQHRGRVRPVAARCARKRPRPLADHNRGDGRGDAVPILGARESARHPRPVRYPSEQHSGVRQLGPRVHGGAEDPREDREQHPIHSSRGRKWGGNHCAGRSQTGRPSEAPRGPGGANCTRPNPRAH
nr:MAG: non-structural polyprotein [Wufeng shrew hepevirus 2]